MGKYLADWNEHPAMQLAMNQREFLMMVYRDWREEFPRKSGRHEAEGAMIECGYAMVIEGHVHITEAGIRFWEGYIAARGEILPGSVVAIAFGRRGYHNK